MKLFGLSFFENTRKKKLSLKPRPRSPSKRSLFSCLAITISCGVTTNVVGNILIRSEFPTQPSVESLGDYHLSEVAWIVCQISISRKEKCWFLPFFSHFTANILLLRRKPLKDGQRTLLKQLTDNWKVLRVVQNTLNLLHNV